MGERQSKRKAEPPTIDPAWAWRRYEPDAKRPWDLPRAGHLFRRAAFGASWGQLQQALQDGPQRTIDRLLKPEADLAAFNRSYDEYEHAAIDPGSGSIDELREWWLRRMIDTPQPLLEKMTLFWHSYFGTTNLKVGAGLLMQRHVQLLRTHALGRFAPLLEAVCRDAATLTSNGAIACRKAQPAEHFARQILERFTLGAGKFSEADVRQTAKALTGWFVVRRQLRFMPYEHDEGNKRILGQEGRWRETDVVRIVLEQPAVSRLVVRRLYRWLISETAEPADSLLVPLAEAFAKDYDVGKLVETVLRSNLFFSATAYRQRVKGPVEFALGIVRGLEGLVPTRPLGAHLAELGQNLGQPPSIQGWEGGRAWISPWTLIGRSNLVATMLAGGETYGEKLNPLSVAKKYGHSSTEAVAGFLLDTFLQGDVAEGTGEAIREAVRKSAGEPLQVARRLVHAVATLPEFHLA